MDYFSFLNDIAARKISIVDLRSEGEFALGAMPLAVNVPLFSNEERTIVGTEYKQVGKLDAIQTGLELVARKLPVMLDTLLGLASSNKRLVLYCWRGGMRSQSVAMLLRSVGIECTVLDGGYKQYRSQVLSYIDQLAQHPLIVLNGRTGTGKTDLLRHLAERNFPVIDLEGLANHRGSAFGDFQLTGSQPSQQNFENCLANKYWSLRSAPRILIENEQNIGTIQMPHKLRRHLMTSPTILIERSFDDRVTRLVEEYAPKWSRRDDRIFSERLMLLKSHIQADVLSEINLSVQRREFHTAVSLLLTHRYDRAYDKSIVKQKDQIKATFHWGSDTSEIEKFIQTHSATF